MPSYQRYSPRQHTPGSGGGATLPGSATNYSAAYGGIPNVPNPVATAGDAIAGNIGNLGSIYALGQATNLFNQGQLMTQYESAIPNYSELVTQQSDVVGDQLAGDVPDDVLSQIIQSAAERGILTGSPGSPNANAAYLRALGITSMDLQKSGMENMSRMVKDAPIAPLFDISKMFVTPADQQAAGMAANVYASAPRPSAAAAAAQAAAAPPAPAPEPWSTGLSDLSMWGLNAGGMRW